MPHPLIVFILGLAVGLLIAVMVASWAGDVASIGGTPVRETTRCEEDETIWWIGVDLLGCVHVDEVN